VLEDVYDVVRGTPMVIASMAAREKFSRDMIDITVDARHKFDDFKSIEVGATSGAFVESSGRSSRGITDTVAKIAGARIEGYSANQRLQTRLNTRTPIT
jgi:hypothetical protein